ncbi:MAG: hypothetical protein RBR71_03070 [Gudongella sp.]|nr:hypothetical protein [Gudongella sp.]
MDVVWNRQKEPSPTPFINTFRFLMELSTLMLYNLNRDKDGGKWII